MNDNPIQPTSDSYVLGYSGIHNSMTFKKAYFADSDLTEAEYRICQGMDSAAVLLRNGEIVAAAAEERFNGKVHTHDFPKHAIEYCLAEAGISLAQLDKICHGFNYAPFKEFYYLDDYSRQCYEQLYSPEVQKSWFKEFFNFSAIDTLFSPIRHHDAHAASAYYMSGHADSLVVVVDGLGETDSISVYKGQAGKLEALEHSDLFSSLGMFYALITMHLGFDMNSGEYKVMGLAPYGDAQRFEHLFARCIELLPEGKINIPLFKKNQSLLDKQTYRPVRDWFTKALIPERHPDEPILQIHQDIAAGLQDILQKALLHIISYWQQSTGLEYLSMAGGVALNCTANGYLHRQELFKDIYIQPAAGDDGSALGAALYQHYMLDKKTYVPKTVHDLPCYGPSYTDAEILAALHKEEARLTYTELTKDELVKQAAKAIAAGRVIGWMQGRMEYGPRALGNRSILASPCIAGMRDKINRMVKKRESFRPFAPSVIEEAASIYFDMPEDAQLPYMLFTTDVREAYRQKLPAVTHINGSARVQTVNQTQNALYWQLLQAFSYHSDFPILLNTSFNVKGQPIACTPKDAIDTFLYTEIDELYIGQYRVIKIT